MSIFKNMYTSMTKNWPGGRRKAIKPDTSERKYDVFNTETAAFTRPYWPEKEPEKKSQASTSEGGMANVGPETA